MKKIQWCCYQHIKTVRNAARRQSVRTSSRLHFLRSGTGFASNYEEILIPMLAALKAIQGNPGAGPGNAGDRTEYPGTKTAGLQAGQGINRRR